MPDHRLKPMTPLGHGTPRIVTVGPVTIAEVDSFALASLAARLGREAEVERMATSAHVPLPGPGRHAADTLYASFWLGPQQWMIEAPIDSHEDIAAILRTAFADAASLTEQTGAWARFDVTAPDLPALFVRLSAFDLVAHGPGSATRTVIDHLGCYVIVRAIDRLSVLGPRSSAHSLHHALIKAAQSVF